MRPPFLHLFLLLGPLLCNACVMLCFGCFPMGQIPRGPSISLKLPEMNLGNFKVSLCETLVRRICGGMTMPQNNPVIFPSLSTSIFSAAGTLGRPGMVMMSPVRATMNPAPALTFRFRTVTVKPSGAPSRVGSSDREYWVFAMHTGRSPKPRSKSCLACFWAAGVRTACAPP